MNELGLTENLMPKNSPIANNQGQVSAFQFDYQNEAVAKIRNAAIGSAQIQDAAIGNAQLGTAIIGTANIGTLSFNEITGGTASFGGTLNGNGVVRVLNSSGGSVVNINNNGIQVTDGNISIQDESGTTILDATGLVSTANFDTGGTTASNFSTTSTSYTDVTGTSLTVDLARESRVIYFYSFVGRGQTPSNGDWASVRLLVDGVQTGPELVNPGFEWSGGVTNTTAASSTIATHSEGSFTIKLQAKGNLGNSAVVNGPTLNYVVLGK